MGYEYRFICTRCSLDLTGKQLRDVVTFLRSKAAPGVARLPGGLSINASNHVLHEVHVYRTNGQICLEAWPAMLLGTKKGNKYHFQSFTCEPARETVAPTIAVMKTIFRRYGGELGGFYEGEDQRTWGLFALAGRRELYGDPEAKEKAEAIISADPPGGIAIIPEISSWTGDLALIYVIKQLGERARPVAASTHLPDGRSIPVLLETPDGEQVALWVVPGWSDDAINSFLDDLQALESSEYRLASVLLVTASQVPEKVQFAIDVHQAQRPLAEPTFSSEKDPGEIHDRKLSRTELEKMAKSASVTDRRACAEYLNTPIDLLARLAKDPEYWVKSTIASRHYLPPEVASVIAKEEDLSIRRALAKNRMAPPSVLFEIASDRRLWGQFLFRPISGTLPEIEVLTSLASNPNTPHDILEKLANHPDVTVRMAVASNPNVPDALLNSLINDKSLNRAQIRPASNHLTIDLLRQILEVSHDEMERKWSLRDFGKQGSLTQDIYEELAKLGADSLATNLDTGNTALHILAQSTQSGTTLETLVAHPNVHSETLEFIANRTLEAGMLKPGAIRTRYPWQDWQEQAPNIRERREVILLSLAMHPLTPVSTLQHLFALNEPSIIFSLAVNPSIPVQVLEMLASKSDLFASEAARWFMWYRHQKKVA